MLKIVIFFFKIFLSNNFEVEIKTKFAPSIKDGVFGKLCLGLARTKIFILFSTCYFGANFAYIATTNIDKHRSLRFFFLLFKVNK